MTRFSMPKLRDDDEPVCGVSSAEARRLEDSALKRRMVTERRTTTEDAQREAEREGRRQRWARGKS